MGESNRFGRGLLLWVLVLAAGTAAAVGGLHLLRRRVFSRPEYQVVPRVTALEQAPSWMGPLGKAHLVRLVEGAFSGRPFPIFQSEPLRAALLRIQKEGLCQGVRAERILPSRVRLVLDVPRPVAFYRDARGRARLVDGWGRPLPFPLSGVKAPLPELTGLPGDSPSRSQALRAGAAVAWQVERAFLPGLGKGFLLRAVDLSNLGYRLLADGERAEVRLVLQAPDGHAVTLEWDRSPFSPFGNIPVSRKLAVARKILAKFPGFQGVLGADLRWEHRWDQWLTLAAPAPPESGGK